MNRQTLVAFLLLFTLVSLGYAIYRSTGDKIIMTESGRQVIYGEPQHGLILGLCVFAGMCVLGIILLILNKNEGHSKIIDTPKSYTKTATNYPQ
jgi:hypothetical protein